VALKIEILGSGCSKCKTLFENTKVAVGEIGGFHDIQKVEDPIEIMNYGITATPALVVNGEVRSFGKLLSSDEIKKLLQP
jgi:small redox-active disulfide protein 2